MSKQYYIQSKYLIGKLSEEQLDLNDLPEFPAIPKKSGSPEYIGFINFFKEEEDYGFIVTNGQGIDSAGKGSRIREVFFHINDWQGDKNFSVGDVVKFALTTNKSDRPKAISISLLDVSEESYNIGKKYIGYYSHVIGTVKRDYITKDFQKSIHNIFLSSHKGKSIVLNSIVNEIKADEENSASILASYFAKDSRIKDLIKEASTILTTEEDLQVLQSIYKVRFSNALQTYNTEDFLESSALLGFDYCKKALKPFINEKMLSEKAKCEKFLDSLPKDTCLEYLTAKGFHPNASVRYYIAKITNSVSWLKHSCVIHDWNQNLSADNHSFATLIKIISSLDEGAVLEFAQYVADSTISSDPLKWNFFLESGNLDCYNKLSAKQSLVQTLKEYQPLTIKKFLIQIMESVNVESEEFKELLERMGKETIAKGVGEMDEDAQYQFIETLPDLLAIDIVYNYFNGKPIYKTYIAEKWDICKAEVPYVVFDIESDGNTINEFAYLKEDNVRKYEGEEQLKSLGRAIKRTSVVVGHNIKQWDLPVLAQKGFTTQSFIWDTLEMEVLLNPCRYAYSLRTAHSSDEDVQLEDKLFWNQLYRLSLQPGLCEELRDFLPPKIRQILSEIQKPYFLDFFKETANEKAKFFQELKPLNVSLQNKLSSIGDIPSDEPTLIIAPQDLWPRISQYVPVRFPHNQNNARLKIIDEEKLKSTPLENPLWNTVLQRFCSVSKTPIVANIAQYLRVESENSNKITFNDQLLSNYLSDARSHIDCIDIDAFEDEELCATEYKHIFIIGSERQDRVHKCKDEKEWTVSELLGCGSKLPLTMASTNIALLTEGDIALLRIQKSDLTANVWAERQWSGNIAIYQNYQYQKYRNRFLSHFNVTPEVIEWTLKGEKSAGHQLIQVRTIQNRDFNPSLVRVNASSTQRQKYWVYQFALLQKVHFENINLPIVYVVNDLEEYEGLCSYARQCGFYIPDEGTGFRKLEYIGEHKNGMVIISKERFINEIGSYRTDKPFCFVWDNMDIDRYKIMWDSLPFEGDYDDSGEDEYDEKHKQTSARQCVIAAWPIFEHYHSMVMANSEKSQFYIFDPYFDDYTGLDKICQSEVRNFELWASEDEYKASISEAEEYFKDLNSVSDIPDAHTAMEFVRPHFIGNHQWYDYQIPLLEHMMERRNDCVISLPTGGGKSVVFQAPSIYRSMFTHRLTLVVSPLRALMQDQVEDLHAKGFITNVDYLSGDRLPVETQSIYRRIKSGDIALLYITPERLRVRSFIDVLYQRLRIDGGLEYVVFDEAHCISQWGQDFRPDYRNAIQFCVDLKKTFDVQIALFSATVTAQVERDLKHFLPDITRLGAAPNPVREHISISFAMGGNKKKQGHDSIARVKAIAEYIENNHIKFSKSCMLVFCRTRSECEETAEALNELCSAKEHESNLLGECFNHIDFFHAGLDATQRNDKYRQFKNDPDDNIPEDEQIRILCTTKAFGMGMDIPNVHYIVHYSPPSVLEDYLQEVGRAGRDKSKYEEAFPNGAKIPALCITSPDDFRLLKDLLVRSQMSWSDLTDCKDAIVDFILRFKKIEDVMINPIVVPYNVWVKNQDRDNFTDVTASRLAFHWLEHIGYLKLKYLSQAYFSLTVPSGAEAKRMDTEQCRRVFDYLKSHAERNDEPSLFSIVDMRLSLKLSVAKIINSMLYYQEHKVLTLNESMRCEIMTRRYWEVKYMVDHNRNNFALRIIFNGIVNLLSDCKKDEERVIDMEERMNICNHLLDEFNYDSELVTESKKRRNGIEEIVYMPWKRISDKTPKGAVTIAETFKKDIKGRTGNNMFRILRHVPGVEFKIKQTNDEVTYRIKVKDERWKTFLPKLENDCFEWIKFVWQNNEFFNWSDKILSLRFNYENNRFGYFEKILAVLRLLSYIDHTPLINSGIEVLANEKTTSPIDEGILPDSPMHGFREEFNEQEKIKTIRLTSMNIFSLLTDPETQSQFIRRYFECRDYNDYLTLAGDYIPEGSSIMDELTDKALEEEEKRMDGNKEQYAIYNQPRGNHVNVLAGPGSGKTHVLTLRCAKLIYREHILPEHILVLAYNRAVVTELRNRLDKLFTKLGMSRIAHRLHVHTFHALAKVCMGSRLNNIPTEQWENLFLNYINNNETEFRGKFPQIEFVLVDEFQDITDTRLRALMKIHQLFPDSKFFTIGDINQSIYGFDRVPRGVQLSPNQYASLLNPQPYYDRLNAIIHPIQLGMFTNYRSYQRILDCASSFVPEGYQLPISDVSIMEHEPQFNYTLFTECDDNNQNQWKEDVLQYISEVLTTNNNIQSEKDEYKRIQNIAVFFRTNNEVYRGYSILKPFVHESVRVRIQGASNCELWREREIYYLLHVLLSHPDTEIELRDVEKNTAKGIKRFLQQKMTDSPNWDKYYLDLAYTLVLNYVESIRTDDVQHTFSEMAEYIKDIAGNDDGGQVYKIYDQYKTERMIQETPLTIILTTMHKVKGLEFDAVFITPSSVNLPMKPHREYYLGQPLQDDDLADIEEERRLLFVAYTRAKKYLHVYKGIREKAIDERAIYTQPAQSVSYAEREPSMEKYFLSYTAMQRCFQFNNYIAQNVKKDDEIQIIEYSNKYYILHGTQYIGRLSNNSDIVKNAKRNNIHRLRGYHVSDVCVWTYEETERADKDNNTTFSELWCMEAKAQGYIYIIQIAGFGMPF